MKAFKVKYRIFAVIAVLAAALALLCLMPYETAYASSHTEGSDESYAYVITQFTAVYDIDDSGYMSVTEVMHVTYTGAKSYAVSRTLAADDCDRVRNLAVYEEVNGEYEEAEFTIDSESGDVEITIGDEDSKTNESHVYKLYYEYYSTDQTADSLTIYPFSGIEAEIEYAEISINLPYTASTVFTLDGSQLSSVTDDSAQVVLQDAASGATLTVSITFSGIALESHSDYSGYYALIILAVLIAAFIVIKLVFFNKYKLNKAIRREPPKGYDPLIVGKLVDNTVSDSDVTSLIYHWAANGIVKINLKDPNKPVITRTGSLPAIAPDYQQILFYKLFKHTNVVYTDELDDEFYKTTEAVKKAVDKKAAGSYYNVSMGLSVLFAVLAALVIGAAPLVYAMLNISSHYMYITGLLFGLPPLVVYGLTEALMYNRYKLKGKTMAWYITGIAAICVVFTVLYAWLIPSNIIELMPKILISVCGYGLTILSTLLITRTEKYNEQLGEILGFRKFIKTAEHVELREAAFKNPNLFYEIYPYAEVLNLEKEWTDKFHSMNIKAPVCGFDVGAVKEVTYDITTAMRTARLKISAAISTSPDATRNKKAE